MQILIYVWYGRPRTYGMVDRARSYVCMSWYNRRVPTCDMARKKNTCLCIYYIVEQTHTYASTYGTIRKNNAYAPAYGKARACTYIYHRYWYYTYLRKKEASHRDHCSRLTAQGGGAIPQRQQRPEIKKKEAAWSVLNALVPEWTHFRTNTNPWGGGKNAISASKRTQKVPISCKRSASWKWWRP